MGARTSCSWPLTLRWRICFIAGFHPDGRRWSGGGGPPSWLAPAEAVRDIVGGNAAGAAERIQLDEVDASLEPHDGHRAQRFAGEPTNRRGRRPHAVEVLLIIQGIPGGADYRKLRGVGIR